jgi:hypothetical protein
MEGKLMRLLAVSVLSTALGMSSGWAQGDLAKALVGKWEGAVEWAGGAGSGAGDPNRTLIIDSVDQKDGKWVATGRYGITGKGLGKVEIEVGDSGSRPFLRFVTGANSTVRLTLAGPKELAGTLTLSGTSQRGNDRRMTLQKRD